MDGKRKQVIKVETSVTLGAEKSEFHVDKRRAAIKAALHAATANLAATASGLAAQAVPNITADDPPWGEVIIGPIWEEKNPEFQILREAAELSFWE